MFKFTSSEIRDLIIAFIVISLCFAIVNGGRDSNAILSILPIVMVGVGAGFILHELGHKFVSMKYGYWAEFKLWPQGLIFALITSFFGFVFAAPGAVYTYANYMTDEINGKISIAGPVVNIILALVFLAIATAIYPSAFYSENYALAFIICSVGYSINSFLAVFNLLPIGNLDGSKVLTWNFGIWIITIAIAGILTLMSMTMGVKSIVRLILGILEMSEEITYFKGTHRVIAPKKTIEINENKIKTAGITRIADITDLDRIGMPVFTAIRPTAEDGAISIYGGKGISKSHAKASAMMEGFERYSAEKQDSDNSIIATTDEISEKGNYIDPKSLNLNQKLEKEDLSNWQLEWNLAHDLISGEDFYVPSNAVYHPYTHDSAKSLFKSNTNGLASGNILEEAILHGMLEVIERDAWSIFELTHKNYSQIDLDKH